MTSFIVGVLGSGLIGTKLAIWTGYNERPLDALGAVLISALIIKILTFLNNQELTDLYKILTRNIVGAEWEMNFPRCLMPFSAL